MSLPTPPASTQSRAQIHTVAHQGRSVCWHRFESRTAGGPPLVLLHGGHGNWQHWARNIDALAARFTVWVPDMPGYGDSDTPPEPTLAALVGLLQATLDQLLGAATPIRLVGFSFGGLVAATLAAQRPQVQRLALLGPGGHGGPRRPAGALLPWRAAYEAGDQAETDRLMRHNLAMHMLHAPASIDAEAVRIHTAACVATRFYSKAISHSGGLAAALQRYTGPLLLAWGEHDVTAVPELAARNLSEGRKDCETHIVPGAGHWVQFEAAGVVNGVLAGWLG
jgi:pimeloyl-ACP methyl ester carboxylesterase